MLALDGFKCERRETIPVSPTLSRRGRRRNRDRRYLGHGLYCKGCGICAAECPCGAIVMEPEKL